MHLFWRSPNLHDRKSVAGIETEQIYVGSIPSVCTGVYLLTLNRFANRDLSYMQAFLKLD